ncbi:MAG: alpha/beta hydrolase [Clostridiales bacterium]|nr:alpha/beta hydrolase [Clostridiales bacterium]
MGKEFKGIKIGPACLVAGPCLVGGAMAFLIGKAFRYAGMIFKRDTGNFIETLGAETPEMAILNDEKERMGEELSKWSKEAPSKETWMDSHDGLALHARAFIQEERSAKWAIVVHGYAGSGLDMLKVAKRFYGMGFNVLLPDLRGHGESEGVCVGMGWHDRMDILGWACETARNEPDSEIALYGLSMGAAAVLMASGEELPENVKCVVEDSGYTSVVDEFSHHLKETLHLPKFPILNTVGAFCSIWNGFSIAEASAVSQIRKCKTPTLFIHGGMDTLVPAEMAFELYEAARCPKEIFIVPEAGHGVSESVARDAYWARVKRFIEGCLEGGNGIWAQTEKAGC